MHKTTAALLLILTFTQVQGDIRIFTKNNEDIKLPNAQIEIDPSTQPSLIRIEESGRTINLPLVSKDILPAVAGLLLKYKKPPASIKQIVDKITADENLQSEEDLLTSGNISFIIFYMSPSTYEKALSGGNKHEFDTKIEHTFGKRLRIYINTNREEARALGCPFPGVYGFNAAEKVDYRARHVSLRRDISLVMSPVLGEMTVDILKMHEDSGLPKLFLFYDENRADEFEEAVGGYRSVAAEYRADVKIGTLVYKHEKPSLGHFRITAGDLPAVIWVHEKMKYKGTNVTPGRLKEVIEDFLSGELEPVEMSGEEPADNEKREVKEITRKGYKKYFYINKDEHEKEDDNLEGNLKGSNSDDNNLEDDNLEGNNKEGNNKEGNNKEGKEEFNKDGSKEEFNKDGSKEGNLEGGSKEGNLKGGSKEGNLKGGTKDSRKEDNLEGSRKEVKEDSRKEDNLEGSRKEGKEDNNKDDNNKEDNNKDSKDEVKTNNKDGKKTKREAQSPKEIFTTLTKQSEMKDAFLVFTAPNCIHCKNLKPIIEKLGKKAKGEFTVGNIDMTENDFPEFVVTGYPTMYLISRGEKILYNGSRDENEMIRFIEKHSLLKERDEVDKDGGEEIRSDL